MSPSRGRGAPRRILVAPDKFKGTLAAEEAAAAMVAAIRRTAWRDAQVRVVPIADGGEGTLTAIANVNPLIQPHSAAVQDPLGRPVNATWLQLDNRAIIEVAAASGLHHLRPSRATALGADTAGTGQLIAASAAAGCTHFSIFLGGSATTDGGTGALRALGAVLVDGSGNPLPPGGVYLTYLHDIDISAIDPAITPGTIDILVDVSDPLVGPSGAAARYAQQKGAGPHEQAILADGLETLAGVVARISGVDPSHIPGCGAAGGFAATFHGLLGARITSGSQEVSTLVGIPEQIRWADVVITGEGLLDEQSLSGKAPVNVAQQAHLGGKPTVMAVGQTNLTVRRLADYGVIAVASAAKAAGSASAAIVDPARWLTDALIDAIDQAASG